jgi:DNA polymerase III subunit chi
MTDIAFYHLERSTLEQALPKLLEKTLAAGKRALVLAGSEQRVEALNDVLWSYDQDAWVPHGSAKDGNADRQPIWFSTSDENLNQAEFLFLSDGATSESVDGFERCFELFDGNNPEYVAAARVRYKAYKDAGHELSYYQQTASGGWQKKG